MKSFDLFSTEESKQRAVNVLMNGKDSDFWKLVKSLISLNVEYLKELVITQKDENGEALSDKQLMEARMQILVYRDVAGTPEHYVNIFTGKDIAVEPLDPYATIEDTSKESSNQKEPVGLPDDYDTNPYGN